MVVVVVVVVVELVIRFVVIVAGVVALVVSMVASGPAPKTLVAIYERAADLSNWQITSCKPSWHQWDHLDGVWR